MRTLRCIPVSVLAALVACSSSDSTSPTVDGITVDRHEDVTMSDLQSAVHVINGASTQKFSFTMGGIAYNSNETSTTANLRLPKPTADVHWPLGGTITTDRTIAVGGGAPTV